MLDLLIDNSITVINNKSIDMNQIIPEIKLREEIVAPIKSGEEIGTIKYKVDDIEYSAKLLAASDVEEKTYYETILIIGGVLLVFAVLLLASKSKRRKKKRR